jgi:hypothetical protein
MIAPCDPQIFHYYSELNILVKSDLAEHAKEDRFGGLTLLIYRKKGEANGKTRGSLAIVEVASDYWWGSGFRMVSPMIDRQNMIPDMPDTRTMLSIAVRTPTASKIEDSVSK